MPARGLPSGYCSLQGSQLQPVGASQHAGRPGGRRCPRDRRLRVQVCGPANPYFALCFLFPELEGFFRWLVNT